MQSSQRSSAIDESAAVPDGEPCPPTLRRGLGPLHLVAIGIGAVIGAGIFVITGHAAASYAGPGVVNSFAFAGMGCLFAALCYAEYASMTPVAGSAYTYTYATFGRCLAWIVGWNLVLEYLAASSAMAVGWLGIPVSSDFTAAPFAMHGFDGNSGFADKGAARQSSVSHAPGLVGRTAWHDHLRLDDGFPASRYLDTAARVDRHRSRHLFSL